MVVETNQQDGWTISFLCAWGFKIGRAVAAWLTTPRDTPEVG